MLNLKTPPLHDIVRLTQLSVELTTKELIAYYDRGPARFNYTYARSNAVTARLRQLPLENFEDNRKNCPNPVGRTQNNEVLRAVWKLGKENDSRIFEPEQKFYPLRKDLVVRFQPNGMFIEDGRPVFIWVQPRREFALGFHQLQIIATVIRQMYIVGDLGSAELEIIDCQEIKGQRVNHRYKLNDLPEISPEALSAYFQIYADSWDYFRTSYQPRPRKEKSRKKDQSIGDLFGDQ